MFTFVAYGCGVFKVFCSACTFSAAMTKISSIRLWLRPGLALKGWQRAKKYGYLDFGTLDFGYTLNLQHRSVGWRWRFCGFYFSRLHISRVFSVCICLGG